MNNAIVLIDTFNRLRSEGVETREAVLKTSAQRLRPIMLTTITTILGLIPMALQINMNFIAQTIAYGGITSVWWVQLSTAVISGLAFSTMLTLIVIPSMLAMPANIVALFKHNAPWMQYSSNDHAEVTGFSYSGIAAGLSTMVRSAKAAIPEPIVTEEIIMHPEDASVIELPERIREKRDKPSYREAAE